MPELPAEPELPKPAPEVQLGRPEPELQLRLRPELEFGLVPPLELQSELGLQPQLWVPRPLERPDR